MDKIKLAKKSPWLTAAPYMVIVAFWLLVPATNPTRFWINTFILVFVRVVGAVSLRTISLSGNMSFAHAAFMGIGAYTAGILVKLLDIPPYISIPVGAILAMAVGIITGLPFARLRSIYFSMATMFLGVAIMYIITAWNDVTGGANGLSQIPKMFKNDTTNYYLFLILAIVCCLLMYRFEYSRIGSTLRALSQSPSVAASIGINETFYRQLAVGVGCFFAGLMGGAYALYNVTLSPSSFSMGTTLWFIMYVMIGGQNKFLGPIIGSIVLVIIPEYFRSLSSYAPFVTAAALIVVVYFLPGGIVSIPEVIRNAFKKRNNPAVIVNAGKGGGTDAA